MRDPALVLLGLPVEVVGADGGEFAGRDGGEGEVAGREQGLDDDEVEVVPAVGPDDEEAGEVDGGDEGVDVIEEFGGLRGGWMEGLVRRVFEHRARGM